jgi:hypothetical protein
MSHVDHTHQTEDDRQAQRHEHKNREQAQPVEGLHGEDFGSHESGDR